MRRDSALPVGLIELDSAEARDKQLDCKRKAAIAFKSQIAALVDSCYRHSRRGRDQLVVEPAQRADGRVGAVDAESENEDGGEQNSGVHVVCDERTPQPAGYHVSCYHQGDEEARRIDYPRRTARPRTGCRQAPGTHQQARSLRTRKTSPLRARPYCGGRARSQGRYVRRA